MTAGRHLLPGAAAAWVVAVLCGGRSPAFGWGCAGVSGLLLAGSSLAVISGRSAAMAPTSSRVLGKWTYPMIAALAVVCAVGITSAWQAREFHAQPWGTWTEQRSQVHAVVTIAAPARTVSAPEMWTSSADQQRANAVVVAAQSPGEPPWHLRSRVQVAGPLAADAKPWTVGEVIDGEFRVSPGDAQAGTMARLSVIGDDVRASPGSGWTQQVRQNLTSALARTGGDAVALVAGMTTGDDSGLGTAATESMRAAGLSHLTAVSGANLAIVTGAVLWLARWLRMPRRAAVVPASAAMLAYVGITGLEPSVLRASVMAGAALLGVVLGGGRAAVALQIAIITLLIVDPRLAFTRGFALSCAATAGLIVLTPRLVKVWRTWSHERVPDALRPVATAVVGVGVVSLAAALATAPLLAAYGQGVSWVSILTNMAASPFVPVITVVGLVTAIVALVSVPVAGVLGGAAAVPAGLILRIAAWGAGVSGARLPWASGVVGAVTFALAVATVWWAGRRWPSVRVGAAVVVVGGALLAARLPGWLVRPPPADWVVVICDVGQGDAALLRTGPRSAVLIDAGPEPDSAVACLQRNRMDVVDAVMLTHLHADHIAGLPAVLRRYRPAHLLVSQFREPAQAYEQVLAAAEASGASVRETRRGDELSAGWLHWRVIAPVTTLHTGSAPNNNSLAVIAEVVRDGSSVRALFGGDMEAEEQTMMIRSATEDGVPADVDVVKVPHHGSANQHPRLAEFTDGEIAVMSCGQGNDYGHPSPRTVADWERAGASVIRTDLMGDVVVSAQSDGMVAVATRRVAHPWQPTS